MRSYFISVFCSHLPLQLVLCLPPPLALSPCPPSLSSFTHTLFSAPAFCFPLGLHLKALLMLLGTNMKRVSLRLPAADGDLGSIPVLFSTGE